MYEPSDDSYLLESVVRERATGRVLDVGTGSGILAQAAYDKGLDVIAVDKDTSVVAALQLKPFPVLYSDRFSSLKKKTKNELFDTIVCNPPYLPDDEHTDIALHGGPKGYEYVLQLIAEAKYFLKPNGKLLLLISTLTRPAIVERSLFTEGYVFSVVARKKLFMEELLVYEANLALGEPVTVLGKGKRSIVYAAKRGAVKKTTALRAKKEASLLKLVNKKKIGPSFIAQENDLLIMKKIDGIPFDKYVAKKLDIAVITQLLKQARVLDVLGLNKQELIRPGKNVLVTKSKKVVLIDFERSRFTEKPANVTQVVTWLSRQFHFDIKTELQLYKKNPTRKQFNAVMKKITYTLSHRREA